MALYKYVYDYDYDKRIFTTIHLKVKTHYRTELPDTVSDMKHPVRRGRPLLST